MDNVVIASSGDPKKDQEILDRFVLHDQRIAIGHCPNGCGIMVRDDPHNSHCEKCGFSYFCSRPMASAEA